MLIRTYTHFGPQKNSANLSTSQVVSQFYRQCGICYRHVSVRGLTVDTDIRGYIYVWIPDLGYIQF